LIYYLFLGNFSWATSRLFLRHRSNGAREGPIPLLHEAVPPVGSAGCAHERDRTAPPCQSQASLARGHTHLARLTSRELGGQIVP